MVLYRVLRASGNARRPPRAIQELVGHRELGTMQRYMHLNPARWTPRFGRFIGRVRLKADTTYEPFPKKLLEDISETAGVQQK
jgi:hypothetical protein